MAQPAERPSVVEAATIYINKGWQVVPLLPNTKKTLDEGWLRVVFKAEDFDADSNIGIRSVNGIIDIDCDAPEVVALAPLFLPKTGCIYGRKSKPSSHWLYRSVFEKIIAFKDLAAKADVNTLVEIRVNHQSMAPPSLHPSGELVEWKGLLGDPAELEPDHLLRCVRLLATSSLIARYYNPPTNRHDWCLALAGILFQYGLTEVEATLVIKGASDYARDANTKDRLAEVRSTYGRSDDEPKKAFNALKETAEKGAEMIKSLSKIWGSSSSAFLMDTKGERVHGNSQENIRRALEKLQCTLTFDEFSSKAMAKYGGYNGLLADPVRNRLWLTIDREFHFRPTGEFFDVVLQDLAYQNTFHPVRDYLNTLKWDGVARVEDWLIKFGQAGETPYVRAIGTLVLVAAVRRIMHPGCKFDELMVLESEQGQLKSTALRSLCPNENWFSDDLPLNVDAKQIIERTAGKWIIEASELTGLGGREGDHLKSMLSRQVDGPVRMAYARMAVEQPRQFIVIGTTNSHSYLSDATGNRRFWPIRCEQWDVNGLKSIRDQLWAEAVHREKQGASVRLAPELYAMAAMQQERRRIEDPWEITLHAKFPLTERHRTTTDDVWELLHIQVKDRTERDHRRVVTIMQRLGFRKMTVRKDDEVVKGWGRDEQVVPGQIKLPSE